MAKNKQDMIKQRLEERKRAESERLKAQSHEDEVRLALRGYLCELLGYDRGSEVWDRFWRVRCHHLWDEHYRVNFWHRDNTNWAAPCKIEYSFFMKYTKLKGFYDSVPDFEGTFRKIIL